MSQSSITQSKNDTADQLIEEIVTRSSDQHVPLVPESAKKKTGISPPVVLTGFALVVALSAWNVARMRSMPDGFAPDEAGTYVHILTVASAIEAFVDSAGRLPTSLSQLEIDQSGLSYVVSGDSYTLSAVLDGKSVSHRRGVPLMPLERGFEALDMTGSR